MREILYSMRFDAEHGNSLEIRFKTNPPAVVRDALKTLDFRWHRVKKCWYGNCDADTARGVIDYATKGKAMQAHFERGTESRKRPWAPDQQ